MDPLPAVVAGQKSGGRYQRRPAACAERDPQRSVDYERDAGPGGMSSPSRPIHPGEDDRRAWPMGRPPPHVPTTQVCLTATLSVAERGWPGRLAA